MSRKSPFLDNSVLEKQIIWFLGQHGAVFTQNANRTSAFFELAAYNDLVRFYERKGYQIKPKNLKGPTNEFRYALNPNARPDRTSYFLARKSYKSGKTHEFEIRHNLRLQSAHDESVYLSPDYSVVDKDTLVETTLPSYYNGKGKYVFAKSANVRTFAETKHYNPSPELVLSFVGLVNEIMPEALARRITQKPPKHCAPALIVSGSGSVHVERIKTSLERRYQVNIFLGLFARPSQIHAASNQSNISNIGTP